MIILPYNMAAAQLILATKYRNGSDLWLDDKNNKS